MRHDVAMNTTLLTTEQVAARLDKSVSTVRRLAVNGDLPVAFQLPGVRGSRLFDPADVLAFLQNDSEGVAS